MYPLLGGEVTVHTRTIPPQGAPIPQPVPHGQRGLGCIRRQGGGRPHTPAPYPHRAPLSPNRHLMAGGDSGVSVIAWLGGGGIQPHHTPARRPYPPTGPSWLVGTRGYPALGRGRLHTRKPYHLGVLLSCNHPLMAGGDPWVSMVGWVGGLYTPAPYPHGASLSPNRPPMASGDPGCIRRWGGGGLHAPSP